MSEIKRYEPINIDGTCGLCAEDPDGAYVDYCHLAALQAELRRLCSERDTLRAQLAAIQGGMGEVVAEVLWYDPALHGEKGQAYKIVDYSPADLEQLPIGTKLCDQRITAAMAAEVETWRSNALMLEQANVGLAQLNGKLRAELAEVKGREAVGEVQLRTGGGISLLHVDLTQPLPPGTKLYASSPASPDVEGLVKALELWLADYDDVAANPDFEPHPHVAERVAKSRAALSTWRQAQEGKP